MQVNILVLAAKIFSQNFYLLTANLGDNKLRETDYGIF